MDYLHLQNDDKRTPEQKIARGKRGLFIIGALTAIALLVTPATVSRMKMRTRRTGGEITRQMDSALAILLEECGMKGAKTSYASRPEYGSFIPLSPLRDSLLKTEYDNPGDSALAELEEKVTAYESDTTNAKRYYQRTVVVVDGNGIDYSAVQVHPIDGGRDSFMRAPQPNGVVQIAGEYENLMNAIKKRTEKDDKRNQ